MRALNDGSAIVAWEDKAHTGWLGRADASGRFHWIRKLQGRPQRLLFDSAMHLGPHAVAQRTVRLSSDGVVAQVEGFSLDGTPRWVAVLGHLPRSAGAGAGLMTLSGTTIGDHFYLLFEADGRYIVGLDARTGAETARARLPFEPARITSRNSNLELSDDTSVAIVSPEAKLVRFESPSGGCAVGATYWRLAADGDAGYVIRGGRERVSVKVEPGTSPRIIGCVEHEGAVAIALQMERFGGEQSYELRLVRDGREVASHVLGADRNVRRALVAATMGADSRFLPVMRSRDALPGCSMRGPKRRSAPSRKRDPPATRKAGGRMASNDRYANLETNYLLQRLESFTGTCLLTTNHEKGIDPAFLRRLSLHLRFELPDVGERAQLWRAMLPGDAPVDAAVDVTSLARRFAMSGGYIRNAALRAAFLAANDQSIITATHLDRAARAECEAIGKIVV